MSKKQVLILWIIAGSLTAALAVVRTNLEKRPDAVTKYERGEKLAQALDPTAVAKVVISDHAHTTTLVQGEKKWTISERQSYPANFTTLTSAIADLQKVSIAHALEAGPNYNPRFGMDESATDAVEHGTRVRFLDQAGEELFALTLGKQTAGPNPADPMAMMSAPTGGRYVRASSDPESVYVVSEQLNVFSANPTAWLEEDFIQIEGIKSITLRAPGNNEAKAWTVTRDNPEADLTLQGLGANEEINPSATNGLKNLFSTARFEDVVDSETITAEGDPTKTQQAVIDTFDGFTYTLDLTPKKAAAATKGNEFNPSAENYFLNFTVSAQLPEVRTKGEDESDEEAKAADTAFTARRAALQEKLAREQNLQSRAFEIAKWGTTPLLKKRSELVQAKEETPPQPNGVAPPFRIPFAPPAP